MSLQVKAGSNLLKFAMMGYFQPQPAQHAAAEQSNTREQRGASRG
jgi:hypothetical protein